MPFGRQLYRDFDGLIVGDAAQLAGRHRRRHSTGRLIELGDGYR